MRVLKPDQAHAGNSSSGTHHRQSKIVIEIGALGSQPPAKFLATRSTQALTRVIPYAGSCSIGYRETGEPDDPSAQCSAFGGHFLYDCRWCSSSIRDHGT